MVQRCTNPNRKKDWPAYGGRGIQVCEQWLGKNGFRQFLTDMGERPYGTVLTRKSLDGHYNPKNCAWGPPRAPRQNQSSFNASEIERKLGFKRDTLRHRLRNGWTLEEAISRPIGDRTRKPVHAATMNNLATGRKVLDRMKDMKRSAAFFQALAQASELAKMQFP